MSTSIKAMALGALVLLAFAQAACEMDPRPPSYLAGLRVLAIEAEPLEAGPGETVTLDPQVFALDDDPLVELSWSFCPFTLGPQAGYACALDLCEVALEPDADGRVEADPATLTLACPLAAGGLPEVFESVFRLTTRTASGEERIALARIPVWTAASPPARNLPPVVERIEAGGTTLEPGGVLSPVAEDDSLEVRVVLDETSLDGYVDGAGRDRIEEPLISFYSSAGRFDYDRDIGTDLTATWTAELLEADQTEAEVFVVVRDLRGGQVVEGPFVIPVQR